ncbi:MAG: DMT family transporter [Pseudomonadota bacterium]|nr:DMT family transporter [Pseudomonadota bacterium]
MIHKSENRRLGVYLMLLTTLVFAIQDSISRHLATHYGVFTVVMIRYWFLGLFVLSINLRFKSSLRSRVRTKQPVLQIFRGILLASEVCVMVFAFTKLGLVESHVIFACYPLIVVALSGPMLNEKITLPLFVAIISGFVGVIILLNPGSQGLNIYTLIPFCSAILFALYNILTRRVTSTDSAEVSYFWTGIIGAIFMSCIGPFFWEPIHGKDWIWMLALCFSGALGHYLLIKALNLAEASRIQPYAYFQLVFASAFGVFVFGEVLTVTILVGAFIIISAGIFTFINSGAE